MRLVFVRESDPGDAMTSTIFSDGPMAEEEFLGIGDTPERIELFDGSLHVTPAPTPRHQVISRRLANILDRGAVAAGLQVLEAVNVRLRPDRIPIPDIVIATDVDLDELVVDFSDVRLVCEIMSPSNSTTDKVLKKHYYAEAGIPWHLLVEPTTGELRLYQLSGTKYIDHSVAGMGEALRLTEPVAVSIDPAELQLRR